MDRLIIFNRKLEQFLFVHGIRFNDTGKDEYNMTWWAYEKNPEVLRIVQEFRDVIARQIEKGA